MIINRNVAIILFIISFSSCKVIFPTFNGNVKDQPLQNRLPSMEVSFGSICKSGLREYVIEDFTRNVMERGDGANGKIIIYLCEKPKFKFSNFIVDYTLFIPLLPIIHYFGAPLYKVEEEVCFTAYLLNKENHIVRRYSQKSGETYWNSFFKNASKMEDRIMVEALEALKSDIKRDLPQIKKELLSAK